MGSHFFMGVNVHRKKQAKCNLEIEFLKELGGPV